MLGFVAGFCVLLLLPPARDFGRPHPALISQKLCVRSGGRAGLSLKVTEMQKVNTMQGFLFVKYD